MAFSQSLLGVRYPTGISYPLSTTSARMAGTGTALKEPYFVGSLNPANLGAINQSVYSLSINIDYARAKKNNEHADFMKFSPAFIGFAFPMGKAGTLGASFKQNGSNDYSYQNNSYIINPILNDTLTVIQKFDNSVSFSAWEFGWGIELFKKISIGASYQIGQYKNRFAESNILETTHANSGLDSTYYSQASSALRGGIMGTFGKFGFGISATYSFMEDLKAKRSEYWLKMDDNGDFSNSPIHQLAVFDTTYKMQLPPSGNIGVSWVFNEKIKVAADFSLTRWEDYWTDAPMLSYNDDELGNAFSASTGVQFIPQPNLLSSKYFQKVKYSGGFAYRELPIDGHYEISISAGLGLPLGNKGIIDVSVETGTRRSKIESNINENFVRINLGMSGGQTWKKSSNTVY